jgi:uncharacterized tellurite resistance protein B-like protein
MSRGRSREEPRIMTTLFARLFVPATPIHDGLSQSQREGIVDLLHFCMCADDQVRRVEERLIAQEVDRFGWDGPIPYEAYAHDSLQRARAALPSFNRRAAFIADVDARLETPALKNRALALCRRLFLVDGEYPDAEQVVFREVRDVLQPGKPDARPSGTV